MHRIECMKLSQKYIKAHTTYDVNFNVRDKIISDLQISSRVSFTVRASSKKYLPLFGYELDLKKVHNYVSLSACSDNIRIGLLLIKYYL